MNYISICKTATNNFVIASSILGIWVVQHFKMSSSSSSSADTSSQPCRTIDHPKHRQAQPLNYKIKALSKTKTKTETDVYDQGVGFDPSEKYAQAR